MDIWDQPKYSSILVGDRRYGSTLNITAAARLASVGDIFDRFI